MRRKSRIFPMLGGTTDTTTESTSSITWQFVQVSIATSKNQNSPNGKKFAGFQSHVFLIFFPFQYLTDIAVKHSSRLLTMCVTTMYSVKHFKSKCSIANSDLDQFANGMLNKLTNHARCSAFTPQIVCFFPGINVSVCVPIFQHVLLIF